MIDYLFWGTIILFAATAIFYIVFFSLIYYWKQNNITPIVVPTIFTFDFFLIGFLIFSIIFLILKYAPEVLRIFI
jgi:hypothetical protein